MRIRNLLIAILTVSSTVAFAQEQRQIKEEGKTVFKPHWFMQVQAGAAHTVGEADFTDLISPAAAVNVGYKFAPAFGGPFRRKRLAGKGRMGHSFSNLSVQISARQSGPYGRPQYFILWF